MQNPRETRTNAADSAPGVDDGRVRASGAAVNSKPKGRGIVWLIVAAAVILFLVTIVAKPKREAEVADRVVGVAQTGAEIEGSTVPGAADDGRPARP
jgi:hypothetical protein